MPFRIKLTKRVFALIDDDDAERVAIVDWRIVRSEKTAYAATSSPRIGKNMRPLHRYVMRAPVGVLVDIKNGNGLDCRKENLRFATPSQNGQNQFVQDRDDKSSRFKGVYWMEAQGVWGAAVTLEGNSEFLGSFDGEVDAARAYDDAAARLFGDFARTNEMMGLLPGQVMFQRNAGFSEFPILKTPKSQTVKREPWEPPTAMERSNRQYRARQRSYQRRMNDLTAAM